MFYDLDSQKQEAYIPKLHDNNFENKLNTYNAIVT